MWLEILTFYIVLINSEELKWIYLWSRYHAVFHILFCVHAFFLYTTLSLSFSRCRCVSVYFASCSCCVAKFDLSDANSNIEIFWKWNCPCLWPHHSFDMVHIYFTYIFHLNIFYFLILFFSTVFKPSAITYLLLPSANSSLFVYLEIAILYAVNYAFLFLFYLYRIPYFVKYTWLFIILHFIYIYLSIHIRMYGFFMCVCVRAYLFIFRLHGFKCSTIHMHT